MPVDEETGLEPEMRIWRMTSKNEKERKKESLQYSITIETIEVCLRTSKPVSWCILESYLVVTDQVSIMCRDEFRLPQVKLYHSDAKDFIRSLVSAYLSYFMDVLRMRINNQRY